MVGPSFSGKIYLMLKIVSRRSDRDIYTISKSPPEQYSNTKIKFQEKGEKIKPLNESENATIVFDDIRIVDIKDSFSEEEDIVF